MSEKKGKGQGQDRKRVLAAIRAQEGEFAAQKALILAEDLAGKAYDRMVRGKELEGLRELNSLFKELRTSYKKSEGFKTMWTALKDKIDDFESGRWDKASNEKAPDPTPTKMRDQGQPVTARADHQGHDRPN